MKITLLHILLTAVILFGLGYLFRYCNEPHLPSNAPLNDTTTVYLPGKPVYLPSDTVIKWRDSKPAETSTDTAGDVIKSSKLDSTVIFKHDTIGISAEVKYNGKKDIFNWLLNIEYKKYDMIRADTIKTRVNNYVPVEVVKSNPLWIITAIVEGLAIILALVFRG